MATDQHAVLPLLKAALVNSEGQLELADLKVGKIGRREILVEAELAGYSREDRVAARHHVSCEDCSYRKSGDQATKRAI